MQVLNIFHVLIAIALIGFVLIQRGQGATAGAAFGSGASGTVFGARGAGNFLSRSTWVLAALFCAISLTMAVLVSRIMTTPEAGLGVVTAVEQAAPAATEQAGEQSLVTADDAPAPVDMPSLAPANEDLPAPGPSAEMSADSLSAPAADSGSADDLPAVEGAAADQESSEDGN